MNPGYRNRSFHIIWCWYLINLKKFYILLKNLATISIFCKKKTCSQCLCSISFKTGAPPAFNMKLMFQLHIAWGQWILGPSRLWIKILQHDDKLKLMRWQTWWKIPRRTSALILDLSLQNLVCLRKLLWAVDLLRWNDNHLLVSTIWKMDLNLCCQFHFPTSHGNHTEL